MKMAFREISLNWEGVEPKYTNLSDRVLIQIISWNGITYCAIQAVTLDSMKLLMKINELLTCVFYLKCDTRISLAPKKDKFKSTCNNALNILPPPPKKKLKL